MFPCKREGNFVAIGGRKESHDDALPTAKNGERKSSSFNPSFTQRFTPVVPELQEQDQVRQNQKHIWARAKSRSGLERPRFLSAEPPKKNIGVVPAHTIAKRRRRFARAKRTCETPQRDITRRRLKFSSFRACYSPTGSALSLARSESRATTR